MARAVAVANVVMFFLFLVCVALQYNDPDPYIWMPMYGAAALACWLRWRGRAHRVVSLLVGLVALAWALANWSDVVGRVPFTDMFAAWKAMTPESEVAREFGGLMIIAAWMLVLVVGGSGSGARRLSRS